MAPTPIIAEAAENATPSRYSKEGFESWWGPDGTRVEVHLPDAQRGNHEAVDRGLHLPAYEAGQSLQLEAVAPRV
jgi:hypothetical protein